MKISRTAAFTALNSARSDRANETKRFVVRSLTKSGAVSKAPLTQQDMRNNAFAEKADADARALALAELNPGYSFVVTAL